MHTFMSHPKGHKTNEVICKQDKTCNISNWNVWRICAESFRKTTRILNTGLTGRDVQSNNLFCLSADTKGLVTLGTITSSFCDHYFIRTLISKEKFSSQTSRIFFFEVLWKYPNFRWVQVMLFSLKIKAPCLVLITLIPSFSLL